MNTLPALRAPLPVLVDEVLALTARLHPDEALLRLAPIWAASTPGFARRGLLAARIALMRRALAEEPMAVSQAVPAPTPDAEPLPDPVPQFVPAPPPKPLKAGALTLLNLDDVAKMLMAPEEEEAEEPAPQPLRGGLARPAEAEEGRADAREETARAAADAVKAKASKPKPKRSALPGPVAVQGGGFDLAAQFGDMAAETAPDTQAAGLDASAMELMAQLTGGGEADAEGGASGGGVSGGPTDIAAPPAIVPAIVPTGRAKKAAGAGIDLSAQFAAMEGAEPVAVVRPKKAAGGIVDLSAQFAAMEGDEA